MLYHFILTRIFRMNTLEIHSGNSTITVYTFDDFEDVY